jgi:prophage regulatory protein
VTAGASLTSYHPINLIRLPELRRRMGGVGRSTVYDWMNPNSPRYDPSFPIPIKLSYTGGAIAWIESEVDEWLAARVRVR